MLARVTRNKIGLSEYLESGKRKDSEFLRNEKDKVVSIYGNLDIFKSCEHFLNTHKNYSNNYLHITLSFNKDDIAMLDNLETDKKQHLLQNLVQDYITHYTSGYDIDNEVIAYAEMHSPIIKFEHDKERLPHIHLGIMLYNPQTDKKLKQHFFNQYIDETFKSYTNEKYNLTQPRDYARQRNKNTQILLNRKALIEQTKNIHTKQELLDFLTQNNYQFREIKTKNNHYFKIINPNGKDINLRGKGFENLDFTQKEALPYTNKSFFEKEQILKSFYEKRKMAMLPRRQPKKATKKSQEVQENSLQSYQQKIAFNIYQTRLHTNLSTFFIDTTHKSKIRFISNAKHIEVHDCGDKIIGKHTSNIQEQVALMLDIAIAKEWNLSTLKISGTKEFKEECERQIAYKLQAKYEAPQRKQTRPKSPLDSLLQTEQDKKVINSTNLDVLKRELNAQSVLDYAIKHYKLNTHNYRLTEDNKINNIQNRQKPKNIIDFFCHELNIQANVAINICNNLYKQQLDIKTTDIAKTQETPKQQDWRERFKRMQQQLQGESVKLDMNISICDDNTNYATSGWRVKHVDSLESLAYVVKTHRYSNATFKDDYRKGENVNGFHNLLIFDIDNDENMPYFSIQQAVKHFKDIGIKTLIIPSKNHQKEKGDKKAVDRFRIIIPTQTPLSLLDSKTFREFQYLSTRALKIEQFVDTKALSDKARYYDKSLLGATPHVIQGERIMNIKNLEAQAIINVREREAKKQQEQEKIATIQSNPNAFKNMPLLDQTKSLSYLSENGFKAIINTPITTLIRNYEVIKNEYNDGYDMIKTAHAKYAVIKDSNLIHDFKSGETYNTYTYLSKVIGSNNANTIAREFENLSGEKVLETNIALVRESIAIALKTAKNDKDLEMSLKKYFGVDYVKFHYGNAEPHLRIADRTITQENLDFLQIIKKMKENREKELQQSKKTKGMER